MILVTVCCFFQMQVCLNSLARRGGFPLAQQLYFSSTPRTSAADAAGWLPAHSACHAGGGIGKLQLTGTSKYASMKSIFPAEAISFPTAPFCLFCRQDAVAAATAASQQVCADNSQQVTEKMPPFHRGLIRL